MQAGYLAFITMGQQEILNLLEKEGKPMAAREIAAALEETTSKVLMRISCMLDGGDISCIELDRVLAALHFKTKRKMRLYYSPEISKINLKLYVDTFLKPKSI